MWNFQTHSEYSWWHSIHQCFSFNCPLWKQFDVQFGPKVLWLKWALYTVEHMHSVYWTINTGMLGLVEHLPPTIWSTATTALQACQLNVPHHHQTTQQSDKLKGYFGDQSTSTIIQSHFLLCFGQHHGKTCHAL